jgi:Uma2 family endonuclease
MSVALSQTIEQSQSRVLPLYRFSVEQYDRMVETGILTADDRVELLEGWVIDKMPHNPPHDGSILALQRPLWARLPSEWLLRIQSAITLDTSKPEPDLAIVKGPAKIYFERHPLARDIAWLIEVSDTTLLRDRLKCSLYARARIPVYWIVNLVEAQIEVYSQPRAGRTPAYRQQHFYGINDSVPLVILGHDIGSIPVRDLLPPSTAK